MKRSGYNFHSSKEQPPMMPALALKHSPAGARAFAVFFVKTIDWGYATTSGSYMRHYYSPSCKYCVNAAYSLDETARRGSFHFGDRFSDFRTKSLSPLVKQTKFRVSSDTVFSKKRKIISSTPAGGFSLTTTLRWDNRWTVVDMVGKDLGDA